MGLGRAENDFPTGQSAKFPFEKRLELREEVVLLTDLYGICSLFQPFIKREWLDVV